jgi:phosphoglycerol transferase MdoB-like AlkP superfamily enzyme
MKYLQTYLKRISILLGMYTASRVFFYFNNLDSFTSATILEFIEGLRFDISALVYINIPIFLILILPHNYKENKYYQKVANWIFYAVNIPFIILNNMDIEYFKFTQKRTTTDFFQLIQLGSDAKNIIPQYLKDYWLITLFSFIQIWLLFKLKSIPKSKIRFEIKSIFNVVSSILIGAGIFIIGARGGLQLKPIKSINAGELSDSQNTTLILNTPFSILHSFKNKGLKPYNYFNNEKLNKIYSPINSGNVEALNKKNIVILILESYSKEFVGFYNNGNGYTPFLDSLMQYGLVFNNAYANGLKSIEALPAITASIPTLMNNPFITSQYAQNKFGSLASLLNKEGYNTSFYHGGNRGTMGFYSFSKKAGFTDYFGMEEYDNNFDFDGIWGIYDEPFMQYFYEGLNQKKEPFFSTLFTLSSHPPYTLPSDYKHDFEKIGIRETVKYTDFSLSQFFKNSKEEDWFKNTIFIITADHTSSVQFSEKYNHKTARIEIPLIIFSGDSSIIGLNNNIVQQIDIMPTLLELINYNNKYFCFGKSMFSNHNWAISKLYNQYRLITPSAIITNKEEKYKSYSDKNFSKEIENNKTNILLLKSIKQTYNERMINNKLNYED